ncbi:MAG: MinD/ParA family protein [Nitrospirae bacterium]|nr:MAG: MinD/ParA family protein [Nitrospirota bacterium]
MSPYTTARRERRETSLKVLSITSGKGGVGKTNIVANLAYALTERGLRVLVLDADLGLGNIDVLLGLNPPLTLHDCLRGDATLQEILVTGPGGMRILPAPSGLAELTHLSEADRLRFLAGLDELEEPVDVFIIDTGAGIAANVCFFSMAAQEIYVVATPEPTSLTDAYAYIKVMSRHHGEHHFKLVVNEVEGEREALAVYRHLTAVCDRFLTIRLELAGFIPHDPKLARAVRDQQLVTERYPEAISSRHFRELAKEVERSPAAMFPKGNIQFFWRRLWAPEAASPAF